MGHREHLCQDLPGPLQGKSLAVMEIAEEVSGMRKRENGRWSDLKDQGDPLGEGIRGHLNAFVCSLNELEINKGD